MTRLFLLAFFWTFLFAGKANDDINALVQQDRLEAAFNLATDYVRQGDAEGDQALAWFYDVGKFVKQDKRKAAGHFQKCADAGLKHCQWRLGVMLDTGDGIEENPQRAFRLFEQFAAQKYSRAFVSLGVMHATGRGTPVDYKLSMQNYRQAAVLKDAHGFYGVGVLYALGQGVAQNRIQSLAWMTVAHFLGDEPAGDSMEELASMMDEAEIEKAMGIANQIAKEFNVNIGNE